MAIIIEAEKRDENKNPRQLRCEGILPAIIYGKGRESVSIQVNRRKFLNSYKNANDEVIQLIVGNDKYNVVLQKLQVEAGTQEEMNIEFKFI